MKTFTIHQLLATSPSPEIREVRGWVRTKRESKNVLFFEINDGSCLRNLQTVLDKAGDVIQEEETQKILTGASVEIRGVLAASQGREQGVELQISHLKLIGEAPADYPLQKKRHSFEFLREIPHLRPRTNTFGALTRVQNALAAGIHEFFQDRGFLWIRTPIITSSDAEGAGDMFQVTTLDGENPPRLKDGKIDYSKDFFGSKAKLTVSGQLQVEGFACSLSHAYTFGPTFRAENSNTPRHLSEFWMVEPEMAFCDLEGNAQLAEDFIKHLVRTLLERSQEDMAFFDKWIQKGLLSSLRDVMEKPFIRMPYTQAMEEIQKAGRDWEFPPSWGVDLQAEHEKFLTDEVIKGPVIVTDYPRGIKAFYMKDNQDEKTVRAMDVLVPRLGEIIGGSQREDDALRLAAKIRQAGMEPEEYQWYLDLRRYGSVPHSGFGLGFERLVQYVTGMQNIRDVIPFPRTPGSITL